MVVPVNKTSSPAGFFCLVLHAHLPFARHPEHEAPLEEEWLFEAMTETYLPLVEMLEKLADDRVDFKITVSISPTLACMAQDALLQERYLASLDRMSRLCSREVERLGGEERMARLAMMYLERLKWARAKFETLRGEGIARPLTRLVDAGLVELATCSATHAYLPLMARNTADVRAQVNVACRSHERCFGRRPEGFWAPECGYYPGLENILRDEGIKYFFIEAHGAIYANPRPRYGVFAPIVTQAGPHAFARDLESSAQVWSDQSGYPADPVYRDFYRDIGYELDLDYLRPYLNPGGFRKMTGVKYHRITGVEGEKDIYDRPSAVARAQEHARHFFACKIDQTRRAGELMDRPPLIVAPYDAELFGHWWFEGPEFLEHFLRQAGAPHSALKLVTPGEYLADFPDNQSATPSASSWGQGGYSQVWLDEKNHWIYRHLHKAGERMVRLANRFPSATGALRRALNQAGRELMLAQASDWAFMMKSGATTSYAERRTRESLGRFTRLYEQISSGCIDEKFLENLESKDNLFDWLDYRVYADNRMG